MEITLPNFRFEHVRYHGLGHEEDAEQVGLHDRAQLRLGDVVEGRDL